MELRSRKRSFSTEKRSNERSSKRAREAPNESQQDKPPRGSTPKKALQLILKLVSDSNFGHYTDDEMEERMFNEFNSTKYHTEPVWRSILAAIMFVVPLSKLPQALQYIHYALAFQLAKIKKRKRGSQRTKLNFSLFSKELHCLKEFCKLLETSSTENIMTGNVAPVRENLSYIVKSSSKQNRQPNLIIHFDTEEEPTITSTTACNGYRAKLLGLLSMLIDLVDEKRKDAENLLFKNRLHCGFDLLQVAMTELIEKLPQMLETIINVQNEQDCLLTAEQLADVEAIKMGLKALMRAHAELNVKRKQSCLEGMWKDVSEAISPIAVAFQNDAKKGFKDCPQQQIEISGLKAIAEQFIEYGKQHAMPSRSSNDTQNEHPANSPSSSSPVLSRCNARFQDVFESYPADKVPHGTINSVSGNVDVAWHIYLPLLNTLTSSNDQERVFIFETRCLTTLPNAMVGFVILTEEIKRKGFTRCHKAVTFYTATGNLYIGFKTCIKTNFSKIVNTIISEGNTLGELVITMIFDQRKETSFEDKFIFLAHGKQVLPLNKDDYKKAFEDLKQLLDDNEVSNYRLALAPADYNDLQTCWEVNKMKYAEEALQIAKCESLTPYVEFSNDDEVQLEENNNRKNEMDVSSNEDVVEVAANIANNDSETEIEDIDDSDDLDGEHQVHPDDQNRDDDGDHDEVADQMNIDQVFRVENHDQVNAISEHVACLIKSEGSQSDHQLQQHFSSSEQHQEIAVKNLTSSSTEAKSNKAAENQTAAMPTTSLNLGGETEAAENGDIEDNNNSSGLTVSKVDAPTVKNVQHCHKQQLTDAKSLIENSQKEAEASSNVVDEIASTNTDATFAKDEHETDVTMIANINF